jgi:hypothetical protein
MASQEDSVIAEAKRAYVAGEIDMDAFEETVAHALRDPSGAYAAMIDRHRPIGSPMFLPPAVEVIKR